MNLSEMFYEYARAQVDAYGAENLDADGLYAKWLNGYSEELGGTPAKYVEGLIRTFKVHEYAEQCFLNGWDLDPTLSEALASEAYADFLAGWAASDNEKASETCAFALARLGGENAENKLLNIILNDKTAYSAKLVAYEHLCSAGEQVVAKILERIYLADPGTQTMLIEIMANYPGNKAVYMWLVTLLYRGDEVALAASLLGKYGDPEAVGLLKNFAIEYDLNYNEFIEVRNAVEMLGGEIDGCAEDFQA